MATPMRREGTWVPEEGVERTDPARIPAIPAEVTSTESARDDVSHREQVRPWPRDRVHSASESLTVDVLRAKLDAAIVAEAWDAVKVIAERLRVAELAAAKNVVEIGKGRGRR